MVSITTLQDLSDKNGIDKYSILREIIQIQFLEEIYRTQESKNLFFKGGTALKIIFGSNRYSEDLDFTTDLSLKEIDTIINVAIYELRKEYPNITIKNIDTLQGVSKKILLSTEISSQPLSIKLDFSQRENVISPKLGTIFTNLPVSTSSVIKHLSDEEILAEKYRAILNRIKGRDLYDFLFLFKKGVNFNVELIKEKLKFYSEKYDLNKFVERIKNWNEKELDDDVRRFLPLKDRQIIPEIKNLILQKITHYI
ncbi:MAG: hypothetical protein ACD_19C00176G0020 [uncultured bacterium]|nr:MAG: hypothetical protein ACD_19C00176G0020 [uncultured bacterium]